MAVSEIDFEGKGGQEQNAAPDNNQSNNGGNPINQEDTTSLNGKDADDITNQQNNEDNKGEDSKQDIDTNNSSTGELNPGDSIEFDGVTYTVDNNGNIIDDKGNIFKESKDVSNWLKSVEFEDNDKDNDSLNLSSIQEALGVTITDEEGNPIEFTNDANGVKSYVDSVIAVKSNELQEAAVNRLYQDNPLLKQFQDYVQLTGSPRGFGELPDRSGIQLDKNNEHQLVAVIKMAASEFGNKSLNDNYIKYLRDSGNLYDEAKTQLAALVEQDAAYRNEIETKAEEQRAAQAQATAQYWDSVNKIVESRQIGKYRIPETLTKEVNGKKVTVTPKDFFDYLSTPKENEEGKIATAYQHDLNRLTDEEYLNREMLDAWLMFTGGTYEDLINMAIREEEVRRLRVKSSNQRSNKSPKIIKANKKGSIDDIVF